MCRRLVLALVAVLASTTSPALADPTILLDTFEDDTIGLTPGAPEVGSSAYPSPERFLVATAASGHDLRTTCPAGDLTSGTWTTTDQESSLLRFSFRARVESGTTLANESGRLDTIQMPQSGGGHSDISLRWGGDGMWRDVTETLGAFSLDTDYDIVWTIDTVADTSSLAIDGVVLAAGGIGSLITGVSSFQTTCASDAEGYYRTDEIRVVEDPIFFSGFDVASPDEWSSYSPAAVPGDECAIPGLLGQGIDTPGTLDGHTGPGDDSSCGSSDMTDGWLLYTAQCTGTAIATTCLDETEFDTVLAAYDGCGGSELACNDDFPGENCLLNMSTRKSLITFPAVEGVTYPIRVSVYSNSFPEPDATEFAVRVECVPAS